MPAEPTGPWPWPRRGGEASVLEQFLDADTLCAGLDAGEQDQRTVDGADLARFLEDSASAPEPDVVVSRSARNRFPGVILGLSGGIDSALSAAVAVDAGR